MKHVVIHLNDEIIEGILVKSDEKHYVVKLDSGYNIGISKSSVSRIVEKDVAQGSLAAAKSLQDSSLPKILILHTGGTIASKIDYKTGAVSAKFEPSELIELFPELKDLAHIDSRLISNMMSDDMRFAHYNIIAKEIEKEHSKYKGIIITHGTDTMHYTGAALSFMFEHLNIPLVLVGSQRSSDRGSSDSAVNLISAVSFIINTSLSGVFICMHEDMSDNNCTILNGLNTRKMHSSRRDAFQPINKQPIARINFFTKQIDYISEYPQTALNSKGKLKIHQFKDLKIGFLISHPNMHHEELDAFKNFDGLILEGTGMGHMPISVMDEYTKEHEKIKSVLAELCKNIPVVMTTQAISGVVNMNVYSPGRELQEMGVLANQSTLTPETAFIKLAWLISQGLDPKEEFMKDFRGEF
ncbi:MAG: Glu-tRNA(Gln) amidotransferase subunit GatD [Candidatus Woesearchaeota archaeon]